jgi:RNA polymerase sigma factor (sigma-70 family)
VENIFSENTSGANDGELVGSALQGNLDAIGELIKKHQIWIYNIALRMTGNTQDAEDATQEILIKMLTKLSSFEARSSFRTWLYRIVANHVLNRKRSSREILFSSFERHESLLGMAPDLVVDDSCDGKVDHRILYEETKIQCMMGMLLCLSRRQRLIFILGAIFCVSSSSGGEIMEISAESFRQELSRARKQLGNYMNEKCSLINKDAPCRCARKTKAAIIAGYVDPDRLQFVPERMQRIKDVVSRSSGRSGSALNRQLEFLYREHPCMESPDYTQVISKMLNRMESSWTRIIEG